MALSLGRKLGIRSLVYVAGEPIPYFWPMRSFIHHNPLHGLEHLPFDEAVDKARSLFHARTELEPGQYRRYLREGRLCERSLRDSLVRLASEFKAIPGIDLAAWFCALSLAELQPLRRDVRLVTGASVAATLRDTSRDGLRPSCEQLTADLQERLRAERPLYESIDDLFGCSLGQDLDELVIKACLDFFDEGQSVWGMPARDRGFFRAWSEMACRNRWMSRRARLIHRIVDAADSAEEVIQTVLHRLQVPESNWMNYLTAELSRLHGWVGFIRWRESAKHYYWGNLYPADLVDYLAVRLTLAATLLDERKDSIGIASLSELQRALDERSAEMYLRHELYAGPVYAAMAQSVEEVLCAGDAEEQSALCDRYVARKQDHLTRQMIDHLQRVAESCGDGAVLRQLDAGQLDALLSALDELQRRQPGLYLQAMEQQATRRLLEHVSLEPAPARDKRPFVQALFCIDTRSERIRRHLESVGDYQTFGIAGFFGVPFSFMELGKGSENHLCPILLTPKNLVLEIARDEQALDEAAISTLEKAMHELKESVLTPFVTVEAIGLLFGFDMLGKTLAPTTYTRWRKHLHQQKPVTYLLQDKLSREQADSIVRAVQRAVIVNAVEHELETPKERITDDMVRELRECALEHQQDCSETRRILGLQDEELIRFIVRLQQVYNINAAAARMQLERLGRIGFSIEEQVGFVSQALRAIGLTGPFSRFVLLIGHGSTSQNNPYESALDCGACGGNHGLVNARVLAQMANKPQVRARLGQQGLTIDDDVWFVPAMHNTTTDELQLYDLDLLPSSHLIYIDRLRNGLFAASRLCARERLADLQPRQAPPDPAQAFADIQRNAMDWSQVRPEWGLSRNAYFIIGGREMTRQADLEGRSFLHSYDYRADPKRRLLENILGGPLVVGQWINMEHYFSTVDNERFGSGSKVYHNVAGRFGVMTGNLSDLRTGLPAQTVLNKGAPYHEPMRLITVIEAPFEHALRAIESVAAVKRLVRNHWLRMIIIDPVQRRMYRYAENDWQELDMGQMGWAPGPVPNLKSKTFEEALA
jgi:uncharacterized protein YbcC (UPF0753/DUF2309 family)